MNPNNLSKVELYYAFIVFFSTGSFIIDMFPSLRKSMGAGFILASAYLYFYEDGEEE